MSLGFALDITMRGLLSTTSQLQLVSQNITNAGKEGYTRKEGIQSYAVTNGGVVPVRVNIVDTNDRYLTKSIIGDASNLGKAQAINDIMDYYSSQLGSTDGSTTLSGYLNTLYGSLQQLSVTPETLANKTEAVQTAIDMTNTLRSLSTNIQELRLQAENKITDTVTSINDSLSKIAAINGKVLVGLNSDGANAQFEDERTTALQDLAGKIDIQYYYTAQNELQLFTKNGQPLVTSNVVHSLSYSPTSYVTSSSVFNPILLNGTDITNTVTGGSLAGNINIRDTALVNEQAKLDEFTSVLSNQMNTLLNKGASLPTQASMTGSVRGLTGADVFTATGNLRIAVVNNAGVLQNYSDINLATVGTVGQLMTALNAIPNVSASLNTDGSLVIASTLANNGISLNEMNSNVSPSGMGASHYFGMQDLFVNTGSANTVTVSPYLISNPNYLASGKLNAGAIAPGDTVITRGDGATALSMAQILTSNVSFAAAGNFSAQSNTLNHYIEAFMADGATQAKLSQSSLDTASLLHDQAKTTISNKSGVNVDEETTKMLSLQNSYESSARMIQTIKSLFETLLQAVG